MYLLWPIYCNGIRLVPNHLSQSTHLQMWMTQCVFLYQIHCLQNTLEEREWMYLTIQRTYICLLLFDNRPTNTDKTTKRGSAYCLNVNLIYLRNNMLLQSHIYTVSIQLENSILISPIMNTCMYQDKIKLSTDLGSLIGILDFSVGIKHIACSFDFMWNLL